jgi:hypothetical protein
MEPARCSRHSVGIWNDVRRQAMHRIPLTRVMEAVARWADTAGPNEHERNPPTIAVRLDAATAGARRFLDRLMPTHARRLGGAVLLSTGLLALGIMLLREVWVSNSDTPGTLTTVGALLVLVVGLSFGAACMQASVLYCAAHAWGAAGSDTSDDTSDDLPHEPVGGPDVAV